MPPKSFVKKSGSRGKPSVSTAKARAPKKFSKAIRATKPKRESKTRNYTSKYRYVQAKTFARPRANRKTHKVVVKEYVCTTSSSGDTVTIYVLALTNGKFYVGKTSRPNVEERLLEHKQGHGSAWTKLHPPLHVLEIHRNADPFDEDKITKKCMLKYGIANVRGGSYSRVELLQTEVDAVSQQLRGSTDQCFICGGSGHFAAKCPRDSQEVEEHGPDIEMPVECYRCGREGHDTESCYAKSHSNGANWCLRCGREGHEEPSCYAKSHVVLGEIIDSEGESSEEDEVDEDDTNDDKPSLGDECQRCGRRGHTKQSCYAKSHANGSNWCLRCGREGHTMESCYAKTRATGGLIDTVEATNTNRK